jgi:hypothetical protein
LINDILSVEDLEDFDIQNLIKLGSSQIVIGFLWFISESLGKFVRESKITSTILIFVWGIRNKNIISTTKYYWIATMSIYFILFRCAFVFGVIVQLENKRHPFSYNIFIFRIPTEICKSAESFSMFGFNYANWWSFIVASRMEITTFKSIPFTLVN